MTPSSARVQDGNSRNADKFVVRLPDGMRARIAVLARQQHRSMNAYIICKMEAVLKEDEEANGTYVEPVREPWAEVAPAQMVAIRPQFVIGMACRYNGNPAIIREMQFHESGDFIEARIDIGEFPAYVPLEDLEPY